MGPSIPCPHCGMLFSTEAMLARHANDFCVGTTRHQAAASTSTGAAEAHWGRDLKRLKDQNDLQRHRRDQEDQAILDRAASQQEEEDAYSISTNSSMSIHLPQEDVYPYKQAEYDTRRQRLLREADAYGRNVESLRQKGHALASQRDKLSQRLEKLRAGLSGPAMVSSTDLLREYQEHGNRNQDTLEDLRGQVERLQDRKGKQCTPDPFLRKYTTVTNTFKKIKERVSGTTDEEGPTPEKGPGEAVEAARTEVVRAQPSSDTPSPSPYILDDGDTTLKRGVNDATVDHTRRPSANLEEMPVDDDNVLDGTFRKWMGNFRRKQDADQGSGHATPSMTPEMYHMTRYQSGAYGRTPNKALLSEISSMREAYLSQGGQNAEIIAQMTDLEEDALTGSSQTAPRKRRGQNTSLSEQLRAVEIENSRLHSELHKMQDLNDGYVRGQTHRYPMGRDHWLSQQKDYIDRLMELERDMDYLRHQLVTERNMRNPQATMLGQTTGPTQGTSPRINQHNVHEFANLLRPPTQSPTNDAELDALAPAPYDPLGGFVVFYDFLFGLDPRVQSCQLVVSLHSSYSPRSAPVELPIVQCEPATAHHGNTSQATFSAKQPVPQCQPTRDISLLIEVLVNSGDNRMTNKGWCKVDLFDEYLRLWSGRWKVPIRIAPVKNIASPATINAIPQYGQAELYLRLVNIRDADFQTSAMPPRKISLYRYPPQPSKRDLSAHGTNNLSAETGRSSTILMSEVSAVPSTPHRDHSHPSYLPPHSAPSSSTLPPPPPSSHPPFNAEQHMQLSADGPTLVRRVTLQVDRVRHAETGEAKVRLTGYYRDSGRVAQAKEGPIVCSTVAIRSNFRLKTHIYGRQEAVFDGAKLQAHTIILARLYHTIPASGEQRADGSLSAWAALPLTVPAQGGDFLVNAGSHKLQLYEPPVPHPSQIPVEPHALPRQWERYQHKATITLRVFSGTPDRTHISDSEMSEDEDTSIPRDIWFRYERPGPPSEPFTAHDGFDLYIDGCRHLPDCVTITKISGRLLTCDYEPIGIDLNAAEEHLDSDTLNPMYNFVREIRQPNIPPTTTLLLKLYTLDRFTKELCVAGYAALNMFVELGTEKQPPAYFPGLKVSLNEGAHQLRLFHRGPDALEPLTERHLSAIGRRVIPGASVLVRLCKAIPGPQGKLLESDKVPRADWARLGLRIPVVSYEDGCYQSSSWVVGDGEARIMCQQARRLPTTVREVVDQIIEPRERLMMKTDKTIRGYIKTKLTRALDVSPVDMDITCVAQYRPVDGIKVSVDGAMNLPWAGFTCATFCLNPPAALYQGRPAVSYDRPVFVSRFDLKSTNKAPTWTHGFKHFHNRSFHRYMTVVVHLQEVAVNTTGENYSYALINQAWTVAQVFQDKYAVCSLLQLPLLKGAPSVTMLEQLTREPCSLWLQQNLDRGKIHLADHASVFVRICDARRDEELPFDLTRVEVNRNYLPTGWQEGFQADPDEGIPLYKMVPAGKHVKQFAKTLETQFKALTNKLYREGKLDLR